MTANDVDMCAAAATDAAVVTEFSGGRKEEQHVRGREKDEQRDDGRTDRGQRVDNGPDDATTANERTSEELN